MNKNTVDILDMDRARAVTNNRGWSFSDRTLIACVTGEWFMLDGFLFIKVVPVGAVISLYVPEWEIVEVV